MLLRNQRYPAQKLTAKMAGNSGGVGTKDFGRVCFIRFFINVNSLLKKINITTGYLRVSRMLINAKQHADLQRVDFF